MSIADFEGLCKGLCDTAGIAQPDPAAGQDGVQAIEVVLNGVAVVLSYDHLHKPGHVVFAVRFGPLPQAHELDACRVLMNLNTHVRPSGSTFCRDPATGDVVLAQVLAFGHAGAVDVYQRIVKQVDAANVWRQHHFLIDAGLTVSERAQHA